MSLEEAGTIVVKSCLDLRPGETFLVITDTEREEIGKAIFKSGIEVNAESMIVTIKPRSRHGEEPPKSVAEMWKLVDAFIAPTTYSLTHTQARKEATAEGARGATMPGITKDIFLDTMTIDYNVVKEYCEKMGEALRGAKKVRLLSPLGTDITMSIEGRSVHLDTGILNERGAVGNLPAGEVYTAPLEGASNGVIVFDGSIAGIGILEEPVRVEIKDGFATEITGGKEAKKWREMLESVGKREAFNLAELGVGCNPAAKIVGNILEDEKVFETVHIALGDNSTIGGTVVAGIHMDGLVKKPTFEVDDRSIIKEGKWLV